MRTLRQLPLFLAACFALLCGFAGKATAQVPAITSFTPTSGVVGTLITINGSNFNRDANGAVWSGSIPWRVQFPMSGGTTSVVPTFLSASQIRATVPTAAVTGPFSIRQGFTLLSTSPSSFTVIQRPRINSFTPSTGPVGTVVTISGSNLNRDVNGSVWNGAIPWRVRFGGNLDVVPTFVSAFTVTAVVPSGATTAQLRLVQNGTVMSTSTATFTVASTATLRLTDNTQYNMVSLTMNGTQQFAAFSGVLIGSTVDLTNIAPGTYTMVAGFGFFTASGTRDVWFTVSRTVTLAAGAVNAQSFAAFTVGQLLTIGQASSDWVGTYFDGNSAPHQARFRMFSGGTWQLFDDGVPVGSGTLTTTSWPNQTSTVAFRVNSTTPATTISFPFSSFLLQNGPPNWPIIQYVRQ